MLEPKAFVRSLQAHETNFFIGVPDSLLKDLCAFIDDELPESQHIIAANEGSAVGIAAGHYLATGTISMVYLQNAGLGNVVNPLLSLADPAVYSVPLLLVVGWRGEPGVLDEPQHVKQGQVTPALLQAMNIEYAVLPQDESEADRVVEQAYEYMQTHTAPYVLLVQKGTFEKYVSTSRRVPQEHVMTREEVLSEIITIVPEGAVFVGTTGKLSRELYELRVKRSESHERDFLTVGSMGHASQIALGIAESTLKRKVVCLDGDGAALMHLGGMATIGARKPHNLIHVIINNGVHESVGGQNVTSADVEYGSLAKSLGYVAAYDVLDTEELRSALKKTSDESWTNSDQLLCKTRKQRRSRSSKINPKREQGVLYALLE
jgi:phosphonopyruvate decarboxylase